MRTASKSLEIQIGSSMPIRLMISFRYFVSRSSLVATVCIEPWPLVSLPRQPQQRSLPRQLLLMILLLNPLRLFQGKVLVLMMRVRRTHQRRPNG